MGKKFSSWPRCQRNGRRIGHSRTRFDWVLCLICVRFLFLFSLKWIIIAEHAQFTYYHIGMASFSSSVEILGLLGFSTYMGITVACFGLFMGNIDVYSKYHQSEVDAKAFSLTTICRIDRIISHFLERETSSIIINSTFLISFELTSNNNSFKQQFEEWSVPIPLGPNVVIIIIFKQHYFHLNSCLFAIFPDK